MFKKSLGIGWENFNRKKPRKISKIFKFSSKDKINRKSFVSSKMVVPVYENKTLKKIIKSILNFGLRITSSRVKWNKNKALNEELVDNTYKKIQSKEFAFIPAGLALYLFMAFIPILTIVFSVFSFNLEFTEILRTDILGRLIPGIESSIPAIQEFFQSSTVGTVALIILLASSFWLSSNGFVKFIKSESLIYNFQNIENNLILRIKGILIVLGLSVFMSLVLLVVIPIVKILKENLLIQSPTTFFAIFYILSFILIIFSSYVAFLLLFKLSPSFKLKFKDVSPGAIVTTIPTSLFIVIFGSLSSIDLINYGNFGTIGTFMFLVILILQLSFYLYAGLIINAAYYQTFVGKKLIPKYKSKVKSLEN
ncbi:YihY/virulence factor BrkB family protein [[Mycoplasma] mobile]|uniref:Conserved hypothetical membrane protein n=1 Tax=Mycoplasma mobile (strain ATCC 43663 / 163K / NCTC 11711) TaxID=267748 RepID=Q6KHR7_MYCM1|nr:YihY/virulence factor BrkB family protein [[Mycoplasma] mobile]AAT27861.1 conserved hypothetical membrane protein [Mycoplasma mobile 163K]